MKYRVWHNCQVGVTNRFFVDVKSVEEGWVVLNVLWNYDNYQYEGSIKGDFASASGLEYFDEYENDWCEWCDDSGREVKEHFSHEDNTKVTRSTNSDKLVIRSKDEILNGLLSKITDTEIISYIEELVHMYEFRVNLLEGVINEKDILLNSSFRDFTKLEVFDKLLGESHIVGTSVHDVLEVLDGKVLYYNLQNGGGTPDEYEFVDKHVM